MKAGIDRFLEWADAEPGRKSWLAKELGIGMPSISGWIMHRRISAIRCRDIERLTGIPRAELRPDVFGEQEDA